MSSIAHSIENEALAALLCCDPEEKCARTRELVKAWKDGGLRREPLFRMPRLADPGRPPRPQLVAPDEVPRRNPGSPQGQAALVHAIAHIEFNAINLALDCAARFSGQGDQFVDQWLKVALEESQHFEMLNARLMQLGYRYGDFPAHNGLWEMAVKTDHDLLARMALVPRLLEARGLDATPPIQVKLREIGDAATLAILDIILREEVGHVAIGDYWYRLECERRGLEPEDAFRQLLVQFDAPSPRPPFNVDARRAAGFSDAEMDGFREWGHTRQRPRK